MPNFKRFGLAGKSRPTVLILGAQGMLGHMLVREMVGQFSVVGSITGEYKSLGKLRWVIGEDRCIENLDVTKFSDVTRSLEEIRPDIVVNCVGLIKQKMDSQSTLNAILVNSVFPHLLANVCTNEQIRLIHFSTDCVFGCRPGPKRLIDIPDATDTYGISKRLGEVDFGTSLTLRTSFVGRQLSGREELFEWVISQRGKSVNGFQNAIYSGLTTQALAKVVTQVIRDHSDLVGLYQVASQPISKFDLITKLNEILQLHLTVEENTSYLCDRSLDGSKFRDDTGISVPSWETMLSDFASDQSFYE